MGNPITILGTAFTATMRFVLHLSGTPDFATLDANGRPKDSFQIFIAFNPATANPQNPQSVDVLVRGDEIHIAHALRIRDARPPVADPNAGGWGAIRGTVPFTVHAQPNGSSLLIFDAPFTTLGITGKFAWGLITTRFGAEVDSRQGVSP
jgi:hypothetical protein